MTPYELEVSAYAAAHKIYGGLPSVDRATPGGLRSAVIDQIAEAIKSAMSIHVLASSEFGFTTESGSVRPGDVSEENRECLENWERLPFSSDHLWKAGLRGEPMGRCTKCRKEFSEWSQQMVYKAVACYQVPLLVERFEFDVERAAD